MFPNSNFTVYANVVNFTFAEIEQHPPPHYLLLPNLVYRFDPNLIRYRPKLVYQLLQTSHKSVETVLRRKQRTRPMEK